MIQTTAIGLSVAGLVVLAAWRYLLPKPYPGVPFNPESAGRITGDIPHIMAAVESTGNMSLALFAATTGRLGSPVAQVLFPGYRRPLIIVHDPREAEDILNRRGKEFDKAFDNAWALRPFLPQGSTTQFTTPELKAQKRLWADALSPDFLKKVVATNVHDSVLVLLDLWRLKATTVFAGRPFPIANDFADASFDTIFKAIVGIDPGMVKNSIAKVRLEVDGNASDEAVARLPRPRGSRIREEVVYVGEAFLRNCNSPSLYWASKLTELTPRFRRYRRNVDAEIGEAMTAAVARLERLETGSLDADELDTCMMDLVLRRRVATARKQGVPTLDPMADGALRDEMLAMMIGGFDSTSVTLTWFSKFMSENQQAQSELRAALRAAFPGAQAPEAHEMYEANIPYLDAVCEETLRCATTVTSNLRQATVDTQILGFPIPKGAQVIMSFDMVNKSPAMDGIDSLRTSGYHAHVAKHGEGLEEAAGRDLGSFQPRRWLVKDESTGKDRFNPYALPALAFGGGYRGCYGRKLAMMNLHTVMTLLILNMEFLELPEEFRSTGTTDLIFRAPDKAFANVRIL